MDVVDTKTAAPFGLGLTREELERWPGLDRRAPRIGDPHFLVCDPLAREIADELRRSFAGRADLRVLDIGCGEKPYLPLVAPYATAYRGLDTDPGPQVDDIGSAEELPYADESFDLVLCTQVLEHAQDPATAVREVARVLAPGGVALLSTHGVFLFHPAPEGSDRDYWRWTHAGLAKLLRENADWEEIRISPNGDVVACLAYLTCQFVSRGSARSELGVWRRALIATLNRSARALDRRFPIRARVPQPGSMSANYLAVARKPSA